MEYNLHLKTVASLELCLANVYVKAHRFSVMKADKGCFSWGIGTGSRSALLFKGEYLLHPDDPSPDGLNDELSAHYRRIRLLASLRKRASSCERSEPSDPTITSSSTLY